MKKNFESKLRGRLVLLDETGGVNRTVQEACFAAKHGSRITSLVAAGNVHAIDLIDLVESRADYCQGRVDVGVLREYDETIAAFRRRLGIAEGVETELTDMLRLAGGAGFNSQRHLCSHLTEGLILNVNALASRALSIPSGEYVIWTTDVGHTMLVPTSESRVTPNDVLSNANNGFEVYTKDLVGCWNKLERVIGESAGLYERAERKWHKTNSSGRGGEGREPQVSKGSSGRPNLRSARLSTGKSLSDVASATGWAIPTIAKAELYSQDDPSNPHSPSYEVIDDLINYYGADYQDAFRTGPVEPYADTAQKNSGHDAGRDKGVKRGPATKGKGMHKDKNHDGKEDKE